MKDKIMEQLRAERLKHLTKVMKVSNPKEWAKSETNFMWVERAIELTLKKVNDVLDSFPNAYIIKEIKQKLSEDGK